MHDFIFIKKKNCFIRIELSELIFIKALAEHMQFVTPSQVYFVHNTLDAVQLKLPTERFCRVHRSYMVSLNRIIGFDENQIFLTPPPPGVVYKGLAGVSAIPLGKKYKRRFRDSLTIVPNKFSRSVF